MSLQTYFSTISSPRPRATHDAERHTRPSVTPIDHFVNRVLVGDCTHVMKQIPTESVDFILTDPPYLVNYRSKDGRRYTNDNPNNARWLQPAAHEMYRVLKPNRFMVSFYGYLQAEKFLLAWKAAGFRVSGHLVFLKELRSHSGYLKRHHDSAYVLTKGKPVMKTAIPDVLAFTYTGNDVHPTQKPVTSLIPLIQTFSEPRDIVLDPFAGSCSTLVAAEQMDRRFIGIELSHDYAVQGMARLRLAR